MHRLIADCGILWFRQILPITTTPITLSVQTSSILATLDHDIDPDRRHILYPAPIHIGRKVWIGAGVIITKGVTIGDNSIVAAGAVVTPDIPSNVIAASVPARILREI